MYLIEATTPHATAWFILVHVAGTISHEVERCTCPWYAPGVGGLQAGVVVSMDLRGMEPSAWALTMSVGYFVEILPSLTWKLCLVFCEIPVNWPYMATHLEWGQQETTELLKFMKHLNKSKLHKNICYG